MKNESISEPQVKISGIHSLVHQPMKVLSEGDLDQIHGATLRILENIGIRFDNPEALALLNAGGARLDGNLVQLPEKVVTKAIESAPKFVTLYGRDQTKNIYLGHGNVHFSNGFGATWVRDFENGNVRESTLEDLVQFTRLADALDLVHMVLFSVIPQDVEPRMLDIACTATVLQNTTKHVQLSLETCELLDYVIKIARIVAGPGNPLQISAGGVPNSPLHYTSDVATKIISLSKENIPCFIVGGAMAGATAPVTLAGMLAQQNAEVLAGLVLHQLVNPGAPVVYGTFSGGFDMRHAKLALGGPELSLITCATQQLCNYYEIPMGYATGGVTDSPISDVQAGIEKSFGILSAALGGVDMIHDGSSGLLGAGMITSLEQCVIDHDMCGSVGYFLQGIPVSKTSLAEDLMASVGPGGNFMMTSHTAASFRKSLFLTSMRARNLDPRTKATIRSHISEEAFKQAKQLLVSHQNLKLSDHQVKNISQVIKEAELFILGQNGG